jgi:exopolyphosphatase/guanosine-5'-triphosphate,3'-diphosphate pyrophosphatase
VAEQRRRLAVIDVGFNTARIAVFERPRTEVVWVVEEQQATLRLGERLDATGALPPPAVDMLVEAIAEFTAIARAAGASEVRAVGTAALRDASNATRVAVEVERRTGVRIDVLSSEQESAAAFRGAAFGLPVDSGYVLDIGGGSLEIVRFEDRRMAASWSVPCGALRLASRVPEGKRPADDVLTALERAVREELAQHDIPRIGRGEELIGTGGTVRNLAKIDRRTAQHQIPRLHGYMLFRRRLRAAVERIAAVPPDRRDGVPGLNPFRADTIVPGGIAVEVVMRLLGARRLLVSGSGLREGVAIADFGERLPSAELVRRASLLALASRFTGRDHERAEALAAFALDVLRAVDPDAPDAVGAALRDAALMLDIGAALDFYHGAEQTAALVEGASLHGYTHRDIALVSVIIRLSERPTMRVKGLLSELESLEFASVQRAGLALAIAREAVRRVRRVEALDCAVENGALHIGVPSGAAWSSDGLARRVDTLLGLRFRVTERLAAGQHARAAGAG